MDPQLIDRISILETKVDRILQSVEKTRKYFQVTLWVTVIFFVVPLVALIFVIPTVLNSYLGSIDISAFDVLEDF